MTSHLDNAIRELKRQSTELADEIRRCERQKAKIDKAIAALKDNKPVKRNRPTATEAERRRDKAVDFINNNVGVQFTPLQMAMALAEPDLRNAYGALLRQLAHQGVATLVRKGAGGLAPTYEGKVNLKVAK